MTVHITHTQNPYEAKITWQFRSPESTGKVLPFCLVTCKTYIGAVADNNKAERVLSDGLKASADPKCGPPYPWHAAGE